MGDRGNIVIRSKYDGGVWLYTHWGGSSIQDTLRTALSLRERWTDPAYLARIVFCEMLHGDFGGTTGYGISTRKGDNEHEIVVADTDAQAVLIYPREYDGGDGEPISSTPFAEFIAEVPAR